MGYTSQELTSIINKWLNSVDRENMINAENYYLSNNKIKEREFKYYSRDGLKTDDYRSNIKIPTSFFPIIVDQKISYCLSKPIIIKDVKIPFDINDEIDVVGEEAAIKSKAWCYLYPDSQENLKMKTMISQDIIDVYDGTIEENLIYIIRLYEKDDQKYAEVWDDNYKQTYVLGEDGLYNPVSGLEYHFNNGSWGFIPFIPLYNNRYKTSDLHKIKPLIDSYDICLSDFSNNFIDFQEIIYVVTNYNENVSTEEAAKELMDWLKQYKIINVRADGKVDILSKEVPYQARSEFLSILRKLIFTFAQAVDTDDLTGGSKTQVEIESYYVYLDMKANKFIKQCIKFIKGMLKFANKWNELKGIATFDINSVKIDFNKSMIINEKEQTETIIEAVNAGLMSKETAISKLPIFDGDTSEELIKIEQDELTYNKNIMDTNIDNGNDGGI